MEETNINNSMDQKPAMRDTSGAKQIAGAIIIAGVIIAGAVLLKGNTGGAVTKAALRDVTLANVSESDRKLGNPDAKLTFVVYEDFQCPFCGQFYTTVEKNIIDSYVKDGSMQYVYRDFAFLGEESVKSAEASRCAEDQGKFWEYHNYLFTHQNGENKGNFSNPRLKSFAKELGLNTLVFSQCLDTSKYSEAVASAKAEASKAGVSGTPKGFIITKKDISTKTQNEIIAALNIPAGSGEPVSFYKTKNIVSINGALPWDMVKKVIDILEKK